MCRTPNNGRLLKNSYEMNKMLRIAINSTFALSNVLIIVFIFNVFNVSIIFIYQIYKKVYYFNIYF